MCRPPVELRQWSPLFVRGHNVLAFKNATRSRVAFILFGKEGNVSFDECPCGIIWSVGETFELCLLGLLPSWLPVACVPAQDDPTQESPWKAIHGGQKSLEHI